MATLTYFSHTHRDLLYEICLFLPYKILEVLKDFFPFLFEQPRNQVFWKKYLRFWGFYDPDENLFVYNKEGIQEKLSIQRHSLIYFSSKDDYFELFKRIKQILEIADELGIAIQIDSFPYLIRTHSPREIGDILRFKETGKESRTLGWHGQEPVLIQWNIIEQDYRYLYPEIFSLLAIENLPDENEIDPPWNETWIDSGNMLKKKLPKSIQKFIKSLSNFIDSDTFYYAKGKVIKIQMNLQKIADLMILADNIGNYKIEVFVKILLNKIFLPSFNLFRIKWLD